MFKWNPVRQHHLIVIVLELYTCDLFLGHQLLVFCVFKVTLTSCWRAFTVSRQTYFHDSSHQFNISFQLLEHNPENHANGFKYIFQTMSSSYLQGEGVDCCLILSYVIRECLWQFYFVLLKGYMFLKSQSICFY